MPIIGILDPSHEERSASRKVGYVPRWLTPEALLDRAYHSEPGWSPYSYELIASILSEQEDRGDSISTTALIGPCPRSTVLERKAEYIESLETLWRAWKGTMVHYVLEANARPNSIAEVRFIMPYGNDKLSCKPDLITQEGVMWDYKNTANMPYGSYPKSYHTEQLQINRWVVNNATQWTKNSKPCTLPWNPHELKFTNLVIEYLGVDYPKALETTKSVQVPNKTGPGSHAVRVPYVWPDDEVKERVKDRYSALRAALAAYPEWPDGIEEVWGGERGWACPGWPYCPLRGSCLASRYPNGLVW